MNSLPHLIAEKRFAVDASQQDVAGVLTKAVYQCLLLEKLYIVDDKTFRAEMVQRLALVPMRLSLEGEFIDTSVPDSLACVLLVKFGRIRLDLKVTFTLRPLTNGATEITCTATRGEQRTNGVLARLLAREEKGFAIKTFDLIQARLQQLCV